MSGGCICPSVISYPSITAATPALWPSGRRGQRTTTPAPALRTKCSSPWTSPMLYRWGLVGRKNAITLSFWSCSCFDNRWWWPGARSASGLIREGKPKCWARGNRHTHHDVIVRVVCWAPSILVAVWAVEYPAVLSEASDDPACGETGGVHTSRGRSHTHVNAGIRADEVCHGQRALLRGVYQLRSAHNLISRPPPHLSDYCASEASVWRPLKFRDPVLFVRSNRSPQRRHALALAVCVGLSTEKSAPTAWTRTCGCGGTRTRTWNR